MAASHEEQYRISWSLFHSLNLIKKFQMNMNKYPDFIYEIKKKYNAFENPYHNFEHGLNGFSFFHIFSQFY
jgi:hypothetical protein